MSSCALDAGSESARRILRPRRHPPSLRTTPSAMIPPYLKPAPGGRRNALEREAGHPGSRRPTPEPNRRDDHRRLDVCPDCHGPLTRTNQHTDARITEDIPEAIGNLRRHRAHDPSRLVSACSARRPSRPVVTDALPGATLGAIVYAGALGLASATGWAIPWPQIVAVFNHHLRLKVTPGGLIQMWYRLQAILFAWYLEIQTQALDSAVLHADETGWRGQRARPTGSGASSTTDLTYFMIDRKVEAVPALSEFFKDEFAGTLVTDFWGPYNAVVRGARRQTCLGASASAS